MTHWVPFTDEQTEAHGASFQGGQCPAQVCLPPGPLRGGCRSLWPWHLSQQAQAPHRAELLPLQPGAWRADGRVSLSGKMAESPTLEPLEDGIAGWGCLGSHLAGGGWYMTLPLQPRGMPALHGCHLAQGVSTGAAFPRTRFLVQVTRDSSPAAAQGSTPGRAGQGLGRSGPSYLFGHQLAHGKSSATPEAQASLPCPSPRPGRGCEETRTGRPPPASAPNARPVLWGHCPAHQ